MEANRKNIFLIGLNDFNREKLHSIDHAGDYEFHGLLPHSAIAERSTYDSAAIVDNAIRQLESFDGRVDGIVGYMDFPVSTMVPVLCRHFGLASPSLESVLKCEHKYWSRLEQSRSVPEVIPRFTRFNPFDDEAIEHIELPYPYWVKPVKSFGSHMGFRITGREALRQAVAIIRRNIERLAEPFNYFLRQAELPTEIANVDAHFCLAEEIISAGRQCTLEGYVFDGEVNIHGVVDSIRFPGTSVFSRYQYPSLVPAHARRRMTGIVERFLHHIDYDHGAFNAEFFWDQKRDRISLLEINPRIAQHHSDLFEKVDGASNHQVAVQVAAGERPHFPHRQGPFASAAVFFIRRFEDGYVARLPRPEEIDAVKAALPGTIVQLEAREGLRLSELYEQDSYSYIIGIVYVGGRNPTELRHKYQQCLDSLTFRFE